MHKPCQLVPMVLIVHENNFKNVLMFSMCESVIKVVVLSFAMSALECRKVTC